MSDVILPCHLKTWAHAPCTDWWAPSKYVIVLIIPYRRVIFIVKLDCRDLLVNLSGRLVNFWLSVIHFYDVRFFYADDRWILNNPLFIIDFNGFTQILGGAVHELSPWELRRSNDIVFLSWLDFRKWLLCTFKTFNQSFRLLATQVSIIFTIYHRRLRLVGNLPYVLTDQFMFIFILHIYWNFHFFGRFYISTIVLFILPFCVCDHLAMILY